jgi:hypothetical protein
MILPFDETGHFTCSQKRTFSLANDTDGLATDGLATTGIKSSALFDQTTTLEPV